MHEHGLQVTHTSTAMAAAALTTVGLGCTAWVVAVQQMNDMNMTHTSGFGSFMSFTGWWVFMIAAMMLPSTAPALFKYAYFIDSVRAVLVFATSYLAVWTLVGVALYGVYPLYRSYGPSAAGLVAVAAGLYELTPLKQRLRERCSGSVRSGVHFGLYCVGSSIGLMLLLVAIGLMNAVWMFAIALVMLVQKLVPAKAVLDVPLALVIVGLGVLIVVSPSSIPGFTPSL
jgi:predicted metal-binding membrane protein